MVLRTKHLAAGKTHTVESFWNATGSAFFRGPAGAKINVKYGRGRLSVNTQLQVLDGQTIKKLVVGKASILGARMRVKVTNSAEVTYDVYPGDVAIKFPEQSF